MAWLHIEMIVANLFAFVNIGTSYMSTNSSLAVPSLPSIVRFLIAANQADLRQLHIAPASTIYLPVLAKWSMIFLYLKFVLLCFQPVSLFAASL